jgi:hypothetical protein
MVIKRSSSLSLIRSSGIPTNDMVLFRLAKEPISCVSVQSAQPARPMVGEVRRLSATASGQTRKSIGVVRTPDIGVVAQSTPLRPDLRLNGYRHHDRTTVR